MHKNHSRQHFFFTTHAVLHVLVFCPFGVTVRFAVLPASIIMVNLDNPKGINVSLLTGTTEKFFSNYQNAFLRKKELDSL